MTASEPDYCQLNQQYTTRYMDPPHRCHDSIRTRLLPANQQYTTRYMDPPHRCHDSIRTRLLPAQPTIHNTLHGSTTPLPWQHENQTTASSTNNTQHATWIHHTAAMTASESDYCQLNQQYITHYIDPPHRCHDNTRTRLLPAQPTIHNTLHGSNTPLP